MCALARNIRADARIYSRSGYAPGVPRRAEGARLDAWAAVLHVHADVVPLLDRALQETRGLPLRWYDVLLELANAPGSRLRMQELGERAVLSRTRVSRVVDELVDAGLVCREPDSEDRRSSFAVLTGKGRGAFRRAAPTYLKAIDEHFGRHLSDGEADTMRAALRRVLDKHP